MPWLQVWRQTKQRHQNRETSASTLLCILLTGGIDSIEVVPNGIVPSVFFPAWLFKPDEFRLFWVADKHEPYRAGRDNVPGGAAIVFVDSQVAFEAEPFSCPHATWVFGERVFVPRDRPVFVLGHGDVLL